MTIFELHDEERLLALSYTLGVTRPAMLALWQLDEALGRIVASTTEPMIGQMRLTWWYERLVGLDAGERAAEPLLGRLRDEVLPLGVSGADLAELIEGWEALLDPLPLDQKNLELFADKRGGTLFALSGKLLRIETNRASGEGWALVDFAARCSDPVTAERAVVLARERLATVARLPKPLRILTRLARAKVRRRDVSIGEPLGRIDFLRAVLG